MAWAVLTALAYLVDIMVNMNLFISGGASGIGRSVVIAALSKGWNVGFSYHNNKEGAQQLLDIAVASFLGNYVVPINSTLLIVVQ